MFKNCIFRGALFQGQWVGWCLFGLLLLLVNIVLFFIIVWFYYPMGSGGDVYYCWLLVIIVPLIIRDHCFNHFLTSSCIAKTTAI